MGYSTDQILWEDRSGKDALSWQGVHSLIGPLAAAALGELFPDL